MYINLGDPNLSKDVETNVSNLLLRLQKKAELEAQLAAVVDDLDLYASRSYRTLKPKMSKPNQGQYAQGSVMSLIVLDKDGQAYDISLEEYYNDRDDSEPSFLAKLEAHETIT